MSKKLTIAFGILCVTASVMTFAFASRDTYHSYITHKKSNEQTLHNNQEILNYRKMKQVVSSNIPTSVQQFNARLLRDSSHRIIANDDKNNQGRSIERKQFPARVFADRKNPWSRPLNAQETVVLPSAVDTTMTINQLQTYANDTFSIQVPQGWVPSTDDSHFFVNPESDMTIDIERVENPCQNQNFMECAINLSKSRNNQYEFGPLLVNSSIKRVHQFRNTIQGSVIQTETLIEGFDTTTKSDLMYISRYFIADLEGNVYVIEAIVPYDEFGKYVYPLKYVFDSFYIYNDTVEDNTENLPQE